MKNAYIGRQPILDEDKKLFAYEVLYRDSEAGAHVTNDRYASAAVINNILNRFGTEALLGGRRAFIKIDEKFLLSDLIFSIPNEFFVFSLFDGIEMNERVVERVQQLHERDFVLAINDTALSEDIVQKYAPILKELSYIKININKCDTQHIQEIVDTFKSNNIKMICTQIEDNMHFNLAKEHGFDLFQGYFFAKPKIIKNKKCDASQLNVIKLYNLLLQDADIDEITSEFENNHVIAFQLLQFINSGAFHFRSKISSIHHILTLMGRIPLAQWLMLMIYSKSVSRNEEYSPLLLMAISRTRLMQNILKLIRSDADKNALGEAYFVGILSLMDTVFSVELEHILEHMYISEAVSDALLKDEGILGEIYILVRNIEKFNTQAIEDFAHKHKIALERINLAVMESIEHVNDFEQSYKAS